MMYRDDQDRRWMAYMDGQMSASEALDFERSLTASEQARLDGEVHLESALCDSLYEDRRCPDALWKTVRGQLRERREPEAPGRVAYWVSRTVTVMAATAAIVIGFPYYDDFLYGAGSSNVSAVTTLDDSREVFARDLAAGASLAEAQVYLRNHDINLRLVNWKDKGGGHLHDVEFLGISREACPEGTLYELRFWCCGKPAKILVARLGTSGARTLRNTGRCRETYREVGTYAVSVVCHHRSGELIEMIQPAEGNLT